jgi:uncharacterized protein
MSAAYLIDGYNLLYAMGLLLGEVSPPGQLEQARTRLLALLHHTFGANGPSITVVFDAAGGQRRGNDQQVYHDIEVRFAIHQEEADDLIEELIRKCAKPKKLVVVSDDHRLQRAASRRQCEVMSCGEFMDVLQQQERRRPPVPAEAPEKSEGLTEAETQHWLEEFGDIQGDPRLRKFFEKYDFEE